MTMDKFITPCELPSAREREILHILIEECAEVQARATKMLRFGRDEIQPGKAASNRHRLSQEVGDLMVMIDLAYMAELIVKSVVEKQAPFKKAKLRKYMQT